MQTGIGNIKTADLAPKSEPDSFRLTLLEGFELSFQGRPVVLALAPQRVTAFLALQKQSVRRPFVAGTLWLESHECNAYASLRSTLWRLQRCCEGRSPIEASRTHLWLSPNVSVDVHEQEALVRRIFDRSRKLDLTSDFSVLEGELCPTGMTSGSSMSETDFTSAAFTPSSCSPTA